MKVKKKKKANTMFKKDWTEQMFIFLCSEQIYSEMLNLELNQWVSTHFRSWHEPSKPELNKKSRDQ